MSDTKPIKFKFAPGVLEQLEAEMPHADLQLLMSQIQDKIASGTLFSDSEPIDLAELALANPEEYEAIMQQLGRTEDSDDCVSPPVH